MIKSVKRAFSVIPKYAAAVVITMSMASTNLIAAEDGEISSIIKAITAAKKNGYGKAISSTCNTFVLYNLARTTYKVRSKVQDGDWSKDTELKNGKELSFPITTTEEISINGGESSDDIKINDSKGYIEYKSSETETQYNITVKNNWENLITWGGKDWILTTVTDNVKKRGTTLIPAVDRNECNVALIEKNDFGRALSSDFKSLLLVNASDFNLPLRIKTAGKWQNENTLQKEQNREFDINNVEIISLNGDDIGDDIVIYNKNGYVGLQSESVFYAIGPRGGVYPSSIVKENVTHFWWNPKMREWYGTQSGRKINNKKKQLIEATFDKSKDVVIFTVRSK